MTIRNDDGDSPTIVLIRHGEVDPAWRGRCYGVSDVPLAPGWEATTDRLAAEIDAAARATTDGQSPAIPTAAILVQHSGLSRSRAMAERLAAHWGDRACLKEEPRLRERDFGTWEGRSWDELWQEQGEAVHATIDHPESFRPGGGETTFELRDRILAWHRDLAPARDGMDRTGLVVAVGHGGPFAALRGHLARAPVSEWHGLQLRCGQWSILGSGTPDFALGSPRGDSDP